MKKIIGYSLVVCMVVACNNQSENTNPSDSIHNNANTTPVPDSNGAYSNGTDTSSNKKYNNTSQGQNAGNGNTGTQNASPDSANK